MGDFHWRDIAVGVGLIAIVAYFFVSRNAAAVAIAPGPGQANQPPATTIPDLPAYLSSNRPAYATVPAGNLAGLAWPATDYVGGLPLPDGLFRQPNGMITGGRIVGGNYVGNGVPLNSSGAALNGDTGAGSNDCGCG